MIVKSEVTGFKTQKHVVDFCVVGGGLSGMCAAIAAARNGSKVAIMQDRPVFGGNASSEIRMWIRGAHGVNMNETGLIEEIALENIYRNPTMNFSNWDSVLFEKVMLEENITMLLNCSCCDAKMEDGKIKTITGWQTTTQIWQEVEAKIFADCSGDSILAPLSGAEYRIGREAKAEFNESLAPEETDNCTMGLSCLLQVKETGKPSKFIAPKWANKYTMEDFPYRLKKGDNMDWINGNWWWMEIGGVYNSIDDSETLRDELVKIAYGVWDFMKNSGDFDAENWELDWLGFLPGKRESRRLIGDYLLTQDDVKNQIPFEDGVAYGGWGIDDHHPKGFETREKPNINLKSKSPYLIPYRCLYSKNVENLMFAGRNISCTHTAISSTRVMGTCAILGQAVGTAAAVANKYGLTPRGVYEEKIKEVQQKLIADDCFLPTIKRELEGVMEGATVACTSADAQVLFDGVTRMFEDQDHALEMGLNEEVVITLPEVRHVDTIKVIFDSDLNRETWGDEQRFAIKNYPMKCNSRLSDKDVRVPETIVKEYTVLADMGNGEFVEIFAEDLNYQRLNTIKVDKDVAQIKFVPKSTWGYETARIYAIVCE